MSFGKYKFWCTSFFEKYVIKFRAKIYCKQGCITCCMLLCVKILERHLSRTNLKKTSVKFLTFLSLSLSLYISHAWKNYKSFSLSLSLSFLLRSFHFSDTQPQNQIKIQIPWGYVLNCRMMMRIAVYPLSSFRWLSFLLFNENDKSIWYPQLVNHLWHVVFFCVFVSSNAKLTQHHKSAGWNKASTLSIHII